jgi:cell division protein FtsQ
VKLREMDEEIPHKNGRVPGKKKKNGRFLFWLKSVLFLVLFSVTVVLLAISSLFNIAGITVQGSTRYTPEDITSKSALILGSNAFKIMAADVNSLMNLRFGEAERNIRDNSPYIKTVAARFILPNRIRISVTERKPMALLLFTGKDLLIDEEGVVLETIDKGVKNQLPVIKGLKADRFELGQVLALEKPDILHRIWELLQTMEEQDAEGDVKLRPMVSMIDAGNPAGIEIVIESRLTVNLGDLDNLNYRLMFLRQIFKKGIKKGERGYLDFTYGDNPNFIPQKE